MFNIGDLVVYGNTGVCRVVEIGPPPLKGLPDDKDYYTLAPYYSEKSVIFTPCDNDKVVLRSIISIKEAKKLIKMVESIALLEITDEKKREESYKEVMRSCDPVRLVSIIKTIHERKMKRLSEGKKVTASDEKYFQMAEEKLYGELAIVLDVEKNEVKNILFVND